MADGFEALDLVGEGSGEAAVDVEGAAAHAGDGAHFLDAGVGEFGEDHGFAGAEGVVDDADDGDVERFGFGALEDGPDLALHAGVEVGQGENGCVAGLGARGGLGGSGEGGEREEAEEAEAGGGEEPGRKHGELGQD